MASDGRKKGNPVQRATPRTWDAITPPLADWILEATAAMGFERMTPVQANTIPLFKGNKDVVVEAVTGSGKTLAFLIPVIEKLIKLGDPIPKHHIGAIIISPTRELATQIHSVLLSLLQFHEPSAYVLNPASSDEEPRDEGTQGNEASKDPSLLSALKIIPQLLLGGTTSPAQDLATFLKNSPNLIISTPGRLLELLSSSRVHCSQSSFEMLVLDEADRLLDLGFKEDLQKILGHLPKQRRTGLFSASVSEAVDQLVRVGLRNPVRISVKVKSTSGAEDKRTPSSLQMTSLITPPTHKIPVLTKILRHLQPLPQKSIVYLSTCAAVDYFSHLLPTVLNHGVPREQRITLVPLHGKYSASIRQKNFTAFVNAPLDKQTVLLTTDVAARGLDISTVDLVISLDPPSDPKAFLHRCGRAGRAGRKGLAVVFLTPGREEDYIPFLAVRQTPVQPLTLENITVDATTPQSTTSSLRKLVLADRSLHEKAQRAFVSWVQSYRKHAASSIFRIQDVDWRAYADAWGLLKMPRMPELKKAQVDKTDTDPTSTTTRWDGDATLGLTIDWPNYAYKDKAREAKRRREMEFGENGITTAPSAKRHKRDAPADSWSGKKEQQRVRDQRREKKHARTEYVRKGKMTEEEKRAEGELEALVARVKRERALKAVGSGADGDFEGFAD